MNPEEAAAFEAWKAERDLREFREEQQRLSQWEAHVRQAAPSEAYRQEEQARLDHFVREHGGNGRLDTLHGKADDNAAYLVGQAPEKHTLRLPDGAAVHFTGGLVSGWRSAWSMADPPKDPKARASLRERYHELLLRRIDTDFADCKKAATTGDRWDWPGDSPDAGTTFGHDLYPDHPPDRDLNGQRKATWEEALSYLRDKKQSELEALARVRQEYEEETVKAEAEAQARRREWEKANLAQVAIDAAYARAEAERRERVAALNI
jgi:hypothetical protein